MRRISLFSLPFHRNECGDQHESVSALEMIDSECCDETSENGKKKEKDKKGTNSIGQKRARECGRREKGNRAVVMKNKIANQRKTIHHYFIRDLGYSFSALSMQCSRNSGPSALIVSRYHNSLTHTR